MEADDQAIERVKQHHEFRSWAGRNKLDESLFVRNYFLSERGIPGWELQRVKEINAEGIPRCIQSLWTAPQEGSESLIRLDVYECESRAAAHDLLIQILTLFQSPLVARREDLQMGDVTFASPGGANSVFARANIVFVVSRAGRREFSVREFARSLDEQLISKPERSAANIRRAGAPKIRLAMAAVDGEASGSIDVETMNLAGEPMCLKFFSSSGEVQAEQGRIVYKATGAGPPAITVYAIDQEGRGASRTLSPADNS